MILGNQQKNLFMNIQELKQIEVYKEEIDIKVIFKNGEKVAVPVYGDWLIKVNNKIFARYKTEQEKNNIIQKLINSFYCNSRLFVFSNDANSYQEMAI